MKCDKCKYYSSWQDNYGFHNECELSGNMYFFPLDLCNLVDDGYNLSREAIEQGLKKPEKNN